MCGRNAKNDNFPQSCSSAEMYIICALGKKYQWQLWDFFGSKKLRLQLSAEMYMWGQKWSMIPSFLGAKIAITTFRRIFGSKNNFPQKCICALGKKFGWLVKRGQTSFEQTRLSHVVDFFGRFKLLHVSNFALCTKLFQTFAYFRFCTFCTKLFQTFACFQFCTFSRVLVFQMQTKQISVSVTVLPKIWILFAQLQTLQVVVTVQLSTYPVYKVQKVNSFSSQKYNV